MPPPPYTCLHPCERHTGGEHWRPGQHNHQNSAEGVWGARDPTHLSDQRGGSHCLLAAAGWDTPVRPSPPPMALCVCPAAGPAAQQCQGLESSMDPSRQASCHTSPCAGAVALTRGHPAHPGTCCPPPASGWEARRLCEEEAWTPGLWRPRSAQSGLWPRRACFRAHLCPAPTTPKPPPRWLLQRFCLC